MLLKLEFVTVQEYLSLLESVSKALGQHEDVQTLSYLAAAVSDFTMDPAEHKLQSGGSLELKLDPVQKLLGKVKEWNPRTYLVSFKLETDASLLE